MAKTNRIRTILLIMSILCVMIVIVHFTRQTFTFTSDEFTMGVDSTKNFSCVHKTPTFLNESRPMVALASFEGSGNSWTRQVLEIATGIYTGSLYYDEMSSFEGSKRCPADGGVFIVKTHSRNESDYHYCKPCKSKTIFTKAILLIRNPFNAMIADYNRVIGGKIGFATQEDFASEHFRHYVVNKSELWKDQVLFWLTKFNKPVHVLIYENLQANTVQETQKILQFLDFPVDYNRLDCLTKDNSTENYYRNKKPVWVNKETLFTSELKQVINKAISEVCGKIEPAYLNMVIDNYKLR